MDSSKVIGLQLKSEFMGFLNNQPATVVVTIFYTQSHKWNWKAFLYWESAYAVNNNLTKGPLWCYNHVQMVDRGLVDSPIPRLFDSETEAHRFAEDWLTKQGFQFVREVQ
jgi:hypothetical protein